MTLGAETCATAPFGTGRQRALGPVKALRTYRLCRCGREHGSRAHGIGGRDRVAAPRSAMGVRRVAPGDGRARLRRAVPVASAAPGPVPRLGRVRRLAGCVCVSVCVLCVCVVCVYLPGESSASQVSSARVSGVTD